MSQGVCWRHTLHVCVYVMLSVSSMPAQWFKYSTWATVTADINNAIAARMHPRYIRLKPEKWRTEGGRKGKERKGGKREGLGFMKTQPPTLQPLLPRAEQDDSLCVCVCERHSSMRWMPRSEQSWRQTVLSYCVLVELTSPSLCTSASQL